MTTAILKTTRKADTRQPRDAAGWLGLAASPTFAMMAWLSANDAAQTMICSSVPDLLPIGSMAWMYLLMSIFHLPPWLKLASGLWRPPTSVTRTEGD